MKSECYIPDMKSLDPMPGRRPLWIAGGLSFGVALLHLGTIFIGARAYRYLGAGERMARMDERGSWEPALLTLFLVGLFTVWAAYAFSGARVIRRLPLLRTALFLIGSVYTLRGLVLLPQIALFMGGGGSEVPMRHLFFSAVSLTIGVIHMYGTALAWRDFMHS